MNRCIKKTMIIFLVVMIAVCATIFVVACIRKCNINSEIKNCEPVFVYEGIEELDIKKSGLMPKENCALKSNYSLRFFIFSSQVDYYSRYHYIYDKNSRILRVVFEKKDSEGEFYSERSYENLGGEWEFIQGSMKFE